MTGHTPPFGRFSEKGKLEVDVRECAVSGQPTESGDPMARIQGTPFFYRVKAHIWHQLTDKDVATLEKRIVEAAAPPPASRARGAGKEAEVNDGNVG